MSIPSIKIENLSKIYNLGEVGTGMLFKDLNKFYAKLLKKPDPYMKLAEINLRNTKSSSGLVKALNDINLEVEHGEVLGIIGSNGAGKSTLLKVLSKITSPSKGRISYTGRLASLLEVGTGMHLEMTAKENIYLNGAILGMSSREINKKFDDIVDFAGVKRYVDTPIKRFSSGMSVRLGFAVAVFLEPDVLIVDEVLAVGDADFQKRAINKMKEISTGGNRTVLFVSHNMGSIKKLCNRAVLMENGSINFSGSPDDVINKYLKTHQEIVNEKIILRKDRSGDQEIILENLTFHHNNSISNIVETGSELKIRLHYKINSLRNFFPNCRFSILFSINDSPLLILSSECVYTKEIVIENDGYVDFIIDSLPLTKSTYFIETNIESETILKDNLKAASSLIVEDGSFYNTNIDCPPGWEGKTVLTPYKFSIK